MLSKLFITLFITLSNAFLLPINYHKTFYNIHMSEGKGFGGGEATRDPNPTYYDPNDPKGKQTAIFKAETYAEYRARVNGFQVQEPIKKEPEPSVTYHTPYTNYLEPVKKEPEPSVTYEQYVASRNLQEPESSVTYHRTYSNTLEPEPSNTYQQYVASRNIQEPVKKEPEPSNTYQQYIASRNIKNYDAYYIPYKPSRNRGQEFDN